MSRSEVRRNKSAPTWLHDLGLPVPFRSQLPFPGVEGICLTQRLARYQCSLTQFSYLEPVVRSKLQVFFPHKEGIVITYSPSLPCRE